MNNLGERLRYLRQQRGLTLMALEIASGVSFNTIGKSELGKSKPTLRTLRKLAPALGVELEELWRMRP